MTARWSKGKADPSPAKMRRVRNDNKSPGATSTGAANTGATSIGVEKSWLSASWCGPGFWCVVIPNPVAGFWRTVVRDLLLRPRCGALDCGFLAFYLPLTWKPFGKICPSWIVAFDQPDFLFTAPALDFFLSRDGVANVPESLEVDQTKDPVAGCEARNEPLAMFEQSAFEIVGYAGVEVSRSTGENVNAVSVTHD
jgi:hypothetical protein